MLPLKRAILVSKPKQVGHAPDSGEGQDAAAPLLGDLLVVLAQLFAATQFIGEQLRLVHCSCGQGAALRTC